MTAATATPGPGPHHRPGPDATADDTITWADFRAWERRLTRRPAGSRLRSPRTRALGRPRRMTSQPTLTRGEAMIS
jgi:hypothetical protein